MQCITNIATKNIPIGFKLEHKIECENIQVVFRRYVINHSNNYE